MNSVPSFESQCFYDAKKIGRSFVRVDREDILKPPQNLQYEWYHSPYDSDFIVWRDRNQIFVRLHFCLFGLTLDWDLVSGTKTGMVVEETDEELSHSIFGKVRYDQMVSESTKEQILAILSEMDVLSRGEISKIDSYFRNSPVLSRVVRPNWTHRVFQLVKNWWVRLRIWR